LQSLSESFKQLTCLKAFKLVFNQYVDDEYLRNLNEDLKNLVSLEKIHIDFGECKDITDEGLKSLGEGLKRNRCLKSVKLRFNNGCEKISRKSKKKLREELAYLEIVDIAF